MAQSVEVFTPVTQLGIGVAVMYTQPANSSGQVVRAIIHNIDTVPRTVTVYRVASGGSPTNANKVTSGSGGRIMPGETRVLNELAGMVLAAGDTIQALADAATVVNFAMSGYNNT